MLQRGKVWVLIRIEYTIDGKFWNHISQDFTSIITANQYVDQAEIKAYAKQIKYLTIIKEDIIEVEQWTL